MDVIEINGKKYLQKELPERTKVRGGQFMALAAAMGMMSGIIYKNSKAQKEIPKVNIPEEYGLIQQKKSKLSRQQRDWVVFQFEKNFVEIP